MSIADTTDTKPMVGLGHVVSVLKPYRGRALLILALTIVAAELNGVAPLLEKLIFDALTGHAGILSKLTPYASMQVVSVSLLLLFLLVNYISYRANLQSWKMRLDMSLKLLDDVVTRIYELSLDFHHNNSIASLQTRIDRGISGFCNVLFDITFGILPGAVFLVAAVVFMLTLSWKLSIVALIFTPIPSLIGFFSGKIVSKREALLTARWSSIFSRFHETLSLMKTVKSFGMEVSEREKFLSEVRGVNSIVDKGIIVDSRFDFAKHYAMQLGRTVIIGYGSWLVLERQITVGTLVAFLSYFAALSGPVDGFARLFEALGKAKVYLKTALDLINEESGIADSANAVNLPQPVDGTVCFEDVSFHRKERPVLDHISFTAEPGTTVAIVGPSGSGKSTLVDMLSRFNDVDAGRITLGGYDIRTITQKSLHEAVGMVLQDSALFHDTIYNNILFGKPCATANDVMAAAAAAGVLRFTCLLPNGFQSVVGERGSTISGGERQRVAIARAILKDPPILIFDEASSALDSESEQLVQQAIENLRGSKTLFVIAHRLSTIKTADLILVMENGRIVERGTHEELIALDGLYTRLVSMQSLSVQRQ